MNKRKGWPPNGIPPAPERPTSVPDARRRLVTTGEAAELLGVSPRTLECWRGRGGGPRYIRMLPEVGRACRAVRYRLSDIDVWIEAREVPAELDPLPTEDVSAR